MFLKRNKGGCNQYEKPTRFTQPTLLARAQSNLEQRTVRIYANQNWHSIPLQKKTRKIKIVATFVSAIHKNHLLRHPLGATNKMEDRSDSPHNRTTELVLTKNNHIIEAFEGDLITHEIKTKGIYEPLPLALISEILQNIDKPTVLDIGANIGNHSLSFSMTAHHVYSFEPIKATFDVLHRNAHRNNCHNITCINVGLSDTDTPSSMHINEDGNIGASSLTNKGQNSSNEIVTLVRGDAWIASNATNIQKIDFMKIDVEGHEAKVLIGLKNTIAKSRPIIMLEYNEASSIHSFRENKIFETIFQEYEKFVIGNSYEYAYHEHLGKRFASARRYLTRRLTKRTAKLYAFDPLRTYANILLVPKSKLSLIPAKSF
jgi:FkbM family methyltransferase